MRSLPIASSLALLLASPALADPVRDARPGAVVAQAERPRAQSASTAAPAQPGAEPSAEIVAPKLPVYRLPSVGKPRRRVGGGRRGNDDGSPALHALVPEHVGLTAVASPALYWVLEGPAQPGLRFELTLSDDRAIEPLLETRIAGPVEPGLHRVALTDHGIALAVGVEYQWSVALVVDPQERSRDVVASGWIERVPGPGGAAGDPADAARRGLWYDALDAAYASARASPADAAPLDALLAQAGLTGLLAPR
jgi:hypothetical protein